MSFKQIATSCCILITLVCLHQNVQAQCTDDSHSTNANDSWLSCQTSTNPNSARGNSHWVMYDLGYAYGLSSTTFWNYNVANETNNGFKDIAIDYSLNGTTWTEAGIFQLPQANNNANYSGSTGLDLTGINARYVLVTALNTWGGTCAGLSEVQFEVVPSSTSCGDFIVTETISDNPITNGIYYSNNDITSNGVVHQNTDVTFKAAESITLQPGFVVEGGSDFVAKIEACSISQPLISGKDEEHLETEHSNKKETHHLTNQIKYSVLLSPNPANEVIKLETDFEVKEMIIISMTGHEIKRMLPMTIIDISSLPDGVYFIKLINAENEMISERFVKHHF